jgi:hypothetical protein
MGKTTLHGNFGLYPYSIKRYNRWSCRYNGKEYLSKRDYVYSMLVMSMTDATIKFARDAEPGDAKAVWDNKT